MRSYFPSRWLAATAALVLALLTFLAYFTPAGTALGIDQRKGASSAPSRAVSYLRDVRPILTQHCFQCHGPDEKARKGKLRLDLRDTAFAQRSGSHVIAPGNLKGSLVWQRIAADDSSERMPPEGKAEPLTKKQIATLKAWIEQGAKWEDHWSFLPPTKPAIPNVSNKAWVRDPLDAFVLARLEREHLKPETEAAREAWLRRASFDLTGLPPTPAEIDKFLKDKGSDAYEKQVDRLLKSERYGERQAQEWLDLARYADTGGYQNDIPRQIWKWREWVINAYNANMPFDQFTIEQLAGDLLPNATLSQKVATGFNRNHPTNSEAGQEEDEYRSAYVIDRVNTTATVFMGLTLACAQCHDHKYDPISQRDYYSFYSFFNNVNERDSGFLPRPFIPVPNRDQEPRLADLKARIDALKQRLERPDALTDAAQKQWERKTLAWLSSPIQWTAARPFGMASRNGSHLQQLDDGSILSTGPAPVKDTYDLMLRPGKKHISAIRLEVLPDDRQPHKALGRALDGRFNLSAIEIRHINLSDSLDPPLVYIARAEADLNQKPKEEPAAYDMFPGSIESAIVIEPIGGPGGGGYRGGWSIVDEERKKPHEAILLPLEPLDTNDASVIRVSLHHGNLPFKSLIGRFRISYTEDKRIREIMLPAQTKHWSSIGPFPAEDVTKAYTTAFDPEKDIKSAPLDLKKSYKKVVLVPPQQPKEGGGKQANAAKPSTKKDGPEASEKEKEKSSETKKSTKDEAKTKDEANAKDKKPDSPKPADAQKSRPKLEKITWIEQRKWRDGSAIPFQGANVAYYLTRKIVSTAPRTARVLIDGPAGFKMWLNGELVHSADPPPPPPPKKTDAKAEGDKEDPPEPDLDFAPFMGRGRSKTEKNFRIGLRQGENEIVLKVVYGGPPQLQGGPGSPAPPKAGPGGGSFRFNLMPEGDDVVTHEVVTALRLEALESAKGPVPSPVDSAPLNTDVQEKKLSPSEQRQRVLREYYRSHIDPIGCILAKELDKLKDEDTQVKRRIPHTLVMEELEKPRQAYIFKRGHYKNRGENVDPATPASLLAMAKDLPRNRLGLAKWLVSGQHPLTARVLVNRIWQQYFGIGIVRTAEDFGVRAEPPTHPELLDYLATEMVDSKWDLKKLHKRIVLSATYRQASTTSKEKRERDPENRLLGRGPRLRLTAEMVRDNALAVSGLLFEKIGGESIKPVQPKNALKTIEGNASTYRRDRGEKQYRRALYVYWQRNSPYPSMLNFDAVPRDSCTVTRATTTTPLQALTLLNDPVYVECAKMLGQRMLKDQEALGRARDLKKPEQDAKRLAYGFRLCTSRAPNEKEIEVLRKLLDDQRAYFKADAKAAKMLLSVGDAKIDESIDSAEAAAWASVGNALLNLDATIRR
jgi:Protein of unknown function (DUF1553)/Protein of unknown function (DUF1549)/Planctomycete cytochrome C